MPWGRPARARNHLEYGSLVRPAFALEDVDDLLTDYVDVLGHAHEVVLQTRADILGHRETVAKKPLLDVGMEVLIRDRLNVDGLSPPGKGWIGPTKNLRQEMLFGPKESSSIIGNECLC